MFSLSLKGVDESNDNLDDMPDLVDSSDSDENFADMPDLVDSSESDKDTSTEVSTTSYTSDESSEKAEPFIVRDDVLEEPVGQPSETETLVHTLIDSGAFNHVCPVDFAEEFPLIPTKNPMHIRTASGHLVKHLGSRLVPIRVITGEVFWTNFQVCDKILKPTLSVSTLNGQGIVVCFGQDSSYIRYGSKKQILIKQKRLYYLPVSVARLERFHTPSNGEEITEDKLQETPQFDASWFFDMRWTPWNLTSKAPEIRTQMMRTTLDQGKEEPDEVSRSRDQKQGVPEDLGQRVSLSKTKRFQQMCGKTSSCIASQLQGQKRSAETNSEDLRDDDVATVTVKGTTWFETATEEQLDENKVSKGMNCERKDLEDLDVYDEVSVEDFARAQQDSKFPELVGSGWIFAREPDESARARCVATQVDYGTETSTFAAMPTVVGLRILLLRALQRGWKVRSADISVAFLHSRIPENLQCLEKNLLEQGWRRLKSESQLWIHSGMNGALLLANVDDILVTAGLQDLKKIQDEVGKKFRTKWGDYVEEQWTRYHGLEWRCPQSLDSGVPCFEVRPRPEYIDELLEEYGLQNCRSVATPLQSDR